MAGMRDVNKLVQQLARDTNGNWQDIAKLMSQLAYLSGQLLSKVEANPYGKVLGPQLIVQAIKADKDEQAKVANKLAPFDLEPDMGVIATGHDELMAIMRGEKKC